MSVRILVGDALEQLRLLSDESVHCVVTSPPYYGLRDYGIAGQIGLEPSPDKYVARIVAVFREVRRVLRSDGTCWLVLGDSYAANRSYQVTPTKWPALDFGKSNASKIPTGYKPKDLLGIPWRVAFALQADGWWLRQDIIWSKPNPMPESVTDRCTKAHEYVFLLTKSERYFYDQDAIREETTGRNDPIISFGNVGNGRPIKGGRDKAGGGFALDGLKGANKRSVWTIATAPYPDAHFATFPPAMGEPCILAGCPEKCCATCGAPWVRVIETEDDKRIPYRTIGVGEKYGQIRSDGNTTNKVLREDGRGGDLAKKRRRTIGTQPSCPCDCGYKTSRGTVLDPFGGAGTTALVADRLGRDAVLIELNPEYAGMAQRRIESDAGGLFAAVEHVPAPDNSEPLLPFAEAAE